MKAFVLDANVAIEWVIGETPTPVGQRAQEAFADMPVTAPGLFWAETRNILLIKERKGGLDRTEVRAILSSLDGLNVEYDDAFDPDQTLALGATHGLTIYDALYLELAQRRTAPLATNDRALRRAAEAEGVTLV